MFSRREFVIASTSILCAPFLIANRSHSQSVKIRQDVMEMADDDPFFGKYAEAVDAMHGLPDSDGRNWLNQARIHANFCQHGNVQFLHWHRHYLINFEAICGALIGDPGFALPYWNWSKRSGKIPAPFFGIDKLNVEHWQDNGVFDGAAWSGIDTVGARGLNKDKGLLDDPLRGGAFTVARLDGIRNAGSTDSFYGRLEGSPHNNGHVICGATATGKSGHMGSGLSPLDPLFWLHHCMVDCMWAEWQAKQNVTTDPNADYAGQFVDAEGNPAAATSTSAMDTTALGYSYDIVERLRSSSIPVPDIIGQLSDDELQRLQAESQARTLGGGDNQQTSMLDVATNIRVVVPDILKDVAATRLFRRTSEAGRSGLGLEQRRLTARITEVTPPESGSDLLVNVFVNCPYLSPETPYSDPHFAGSFSFFGRMAGHHGHEFLIDITEPVQALTQEGRIDPEKIEVQFMPLSASPDAVSKATFKAGKVEILSS